MDKEEKFKVVVYNTYFAFIFDNKYKTRVRDGLEQIIKELTIFKYEFNPKTKRYHAVHYKDIYGLEENPYFTTYLFPITILARTIKCIMEEFKEKNLKVSEFVHPDIDIPIAKIRCELKPEFKLRDYQVKCLDILADKSLGRFALIDLRTGMGKSIIGTFALFNNRYRTAILVLPKYIEKWIDDILKYTTAKREDFYVVQGMDSLKNLLEEVERGVNYDFIIFSLRTLHNFHKDGVDFCSKTDLFNRLKIGTILSDESHQETSALFTACMFSNVKQVIGMSATYITNQKEEKMIQDLLFPLNCRISNLTNYNKYIDIVNVKYDIDRRFRVRYKSQHGYSHIAFEQSILGNTKTREQYFELIAWCIEDHYIRNRKPGDKCLIFLSTVTGCTRLTEYLKKRFKDKDLNILRYTQDDPYENVLTADICCSTILSSGVAIDIPKLIQVVQTITLASPKANIQAIGRLRFLEDRDTKYYKLVCRNIKRQNEIHREANKLYSSIASTNIEKNYDNLITPFVTPNMGKLTF